MKTYAYRFMLHTYPPGTLQEGFIKAHHHHHAKAKVQKICREQVIVDETSGRWSGWGQRKDIYGCSFLDKHFQQYRFRLLLTEITTLCETARNASPPIDQLLPAWE